MPSNGYDRDFAKGCLAAIAAGLVGLIMAYILFG